MRKLVSNFDAAWKEALHGFLQEAVAFFLPDAYEEIDWERRPEFLEQELRKAIRAGRRRRGERVVDVLAKVYRKGGEPMWLLLHVEVQAQPTADFPKRMFECNTMLFVNHECPVVSVGILADTQEDWRPKSFSYSMWGCTVGVQFPIIKLLDYRQRWDWLEAHPSPFAVVVMAHLKTQETQSDPAERKAWKFRLVRMLYERGLNHAQIQKLLRFLELVMVLPEELEREFGRDVERYEEERQMPVMMPIERIFKRDATIETTRENTMDVLRIRFGRVPARITRGLADITTRKNLQRLFEQAVTISSLDEFERLLATPATRQRRG